MNILKQFWVWAVLGLGLFLGGCATVSGPAVQRMPVDQHGRLAGTGFEAIDLMVACHEIDEIMNAMVRTPGVGEFDVVVDPVKNDTRFQLPEEAFNRAIYGQLLSSSPPKCHLMQPDSSIEPQMYLMGRLQRILPELPRDHEVLLYSYRLVDATNNEVVWEGSCEVTTHLGVASTEPVLKASASVEM